MKLYGDIENVLCFSRKRVSEASTHFATLQINHWDSGIDLLPWPQDLWSTQLLRAMPLLHPPSSLTFDETPSLWRHVFDFPLLHSPRAEVIHLFPLWQWQGCIFFLGWMKNWGNWSFLFASIEGSASSLRKILDVLVTFVLSNLVSAWRLVVFKCFFF